MTVPPSPGVPVYVIREGTEAHNDFVAKSWVETFRGGDKAHRYIEPGFFNRSIYPEIEEILLRAEVRVAGPVDDETTVYGFAVLEPGTVHMVYVRKPWRRYGIAKALLTDVDLPSSDWTTQSMDFREWIRFRYPMRGYRPFWMKERNQNG
jgi:GNAT superfamily N-acetyltransferase